MFLLLLIVIITLLSIANRKSQLSRHDAKVSSNLHEAVGHADLIASANLTLHKCDKFAYKKGNTL